MPISRTETAFGPGDTGASVPVKPVAPGFSTNGSGSVTITAPGANGNDPVVTYSIRVKADGVLAGYVQTDGTVDASAVYRLLVDWGATIEVTGLTDFVAYTFASAGRNELGVDGAYSDESAVMNTLPDIDEGIEQRTPAEREVTTGNVRVDPVAGVVISGDLVPEVTGTEYYGVVIASYTAESYESDTAAAEVEYSEDDGATWSTATSKAGTGDGKTGITSSPTGVAHTFGWDSYPDAGNSEYQTDVKIRIRLQDAEGDWGAWVVSEVFTLRNLPGELVFSPADAREWDEDTTPAFEATMPLLRGGSRGFPVISIYSTAEGTPLVSGYPRKSVESQAGWEYLSASDVWTAMTPGGVPDTAKKVRYTVQDALAAGDYLVTGKMGEVRDKG